MSKSSQIQIRTWTYRDNINGVVTDARAIMYLADYSFAGYDFLTLN